MAKSRSRRAPPKPAGGDVPLIRRLRGIRVAPRGIAKVLLLFVVLAFLGVFYPVILENVGFGIALVVCWIGIGALMISKRRVRAVAKWWNFWAGALLATLAVWGILSLFSPSLTLGDVKFSGWHSRGQLHRQPGGGRTFLAAPGTHPAGIRVRYPALSESGLRQTARRRCQDSWNGDAIRRAVDRAKSTYERCRSHSKTTAEPLRRSTAACGPFPSRGHWSRQGSGDRDHPTPGGTLKDAVRSH